MKAAQPIHVVDLIPQLHQELLVLLRSLGPEDWTKPTACTGWTVKDVAAHLLDGDIRRLSFQRDGLEPLAPAQPITDFQELVAFLNELNATWVQAARRISPVLLIDLLAGTGEQLGAFLQSLDPFAPAPHPVAWAGEAISPNWFDIAREYTEKWHHQQHIREAVGAPSLVSRQWLHPALDTFLRALPHHYRGVAAAEKSSLVIEIGGEAGGAWSLQREGQSWQLYHGAPEHPQARIRLDADTAWRLFSKGLSHEVARQHSLIQGDESLAESFFSTVAIMA